MVSKNITKRQKEFLKAIADSLVSEGYPPTFDELKEKFGISSNQAIIDHLNALEKKNLIVKDGTSRGIKLTQLGYKALGRNSLVPMAGASYAGSFTETFTIQGQWVELSEQVERLSSEVYVIKVSGDSMINAGIDDGDQLLVQVQDHFKSNDIVVAKAAVGTTVKRFIRQNKPPFISLRPENPKYKHISFTDEVEMQGKVIGKLVNNHWQQLTQGRFL